MKATELEVKMVDKQIETNRKVGRSFRIALIPQFKCAISCMQTEENSTNPFFGSSSLKSHCLNSPGVAAALTYRFN
jgi:hypothetical protein